jgi:hypothetical protein
MEAEPWSLNLKKDRIFLLLRLTRVLETWVVVMDSEIRYHFF